MFHERDGSFWKNTWLTIGAVLVLGLQSVSAGPRAVLLEPRSIDAGEVEPSQILNYTFVLRNDGDATLAIGDIEPTCYCTTAKTTLWDVPPSATAKIHVRIDPSDFVGKINKGVEITTNDPKNPRLVVDVSLVVRPGIAIVPPELDFGNVGPEGTSSLQVDLKAPRQRKFEVVKVTSEATYLELDHEPLELEDRTGAMVFVKVLPGAPSGTFETHAIVHTNDKARPTIEIPVRGKGPGGLTASPDRIVFPGAAAGAEVGSFHLAGGAGLHVSTSSKSLQAKLTPEENGGYRVHLMLADEARPGRLLAKVFVATSAGGEPELTVPVMGIVR